MLRVTLDFQALGKDFQTIFVEELGVTMSKHDIFKALVSDPMEGAIDVDWRDFFPYLKWVPNKRLEQKIQRMSSRRQAVMNALIREQRERFAAGEVNFLINLDKSSFSSFVVT